MTYNSWKDFKYISLSHRSAQETNHVCPNTYFGSSVVV